MDAAALEWLAWPMPITASPGAAASDLSGRTDCRRHVRADTIAISTALVEAGDRVLPAPCDPDRTDDPTVAHLASIGVEVRARAGHGDRGTDVDGLDPHPSTRIRPRLERHEPDGRRVHLLDRGSLVDLPAGLGVSGLAALLLPDEDTAVVVHAAHLAPADDVRTAAPGADAGATIRGGDAPAAPERGRSSGRDAH